jgi:hypothetical protein
VVLVLGNFEEFFEQVEQGTSVSEFCEQGGQRLSPREEHERRVGGVEVYFIFLEMAIKLLEACLELLMRCA